MATITIGGLATGLDTDSIVTQLVALERQRGVGVLQTQRTDANTRRIALQTFNTKVAAFLTAVNKLKNPDDVLVRKAASSDEAVLTATAGSGAHAGATEITVEQLARPAIATSANGKAAATSTVATGSGSFAFRVGPSGPVQTVAIDATTTLADLAAAIDALDAGASAAVINVGTTASPDYRLRLASDATGTESAVSIVTDDTTLGVAVTQSARDAQFTVSGFADPLTRSGNSFDDVLPGVAIELRAAGGPVTVTVTGDDDAIAAQVDGVVQAFNDIVRFVADESTIEQDTSSDDRTVSIGPLALDATVRGILQSLRGIISGPTTTGDDGADPYTVLAQVGVTTARDGTLTFDQAAFRAQLQSRGSDVAKLFAGANGGSGVADRLSEYLTAVTQSGGLIDVHNTAVADEIRSLEERIAAGQRNLDAFEENLRAQFTSLEVLVQSLKSQGSFLAGALGSQS
ncbi:MAG: flagellar filament capping protein FliD [Deltaproteobacteria bacterium]|nr:flagellar filament capping protein FliD [Deltaproteobacteria bacterium]